MKIKNLLLALLALPLLFVSCQKENPAVDEVKDPTVAIVAGEVTETSITFTITSTEATKVAYIVVEGTEAPTASGTPLRPLWPCRWPSHSAVSGA